MEREGEVRGRGRRRGGEMRKGIVIGGMVIGLLMGCNNGVAELENENKFLSSISSLGKGFLSIFTDLGDMVTGVFGINADTKKEEIGKYFNDIATTMESVKKKLKDEVANNGNYEKVKKVVEQFITEKLDKIAKGAKEVSEVAKGTEFLGYMPNTATPGSDGGEIDKLIQGIKTIMGVIDLKEGNHDAGNEKAATDNQAARAASSDDAGHLFASDQAGTADTNAKKAANDAAKAVGAVSGADILKTIYSDKATALAKNNTGHASVNNVRDAKDAVVAGAVALRAMAKGGKFAGNTGSVADAIAIVKDAAASAVNKTLGTLIMAIRRTVDGGLKTISKALAEVKQEDMSAETNESGAAK